MIYGSADRPAAYLFNLVLWDWTTGEGFSPRLGALAGITRSSIVHMAKKMGINTEKKTLTRHDLYNASECFLTGTAAELIPVVKIDGRIIGAGKPGPIFKKLLAEFRKLTKTDGYKVYGKKK